MDLDTNTELIVFCTKRINGSFKHLLEKHRNAGLGVDNFEECIIFRVLEDRKDIDFMRAYVDARKKIVTTSRIVGKLQSQICVKKTSCITKNSIVKVGYYNEPWN